MFLPAVRSDGDGQTQSPPVLQPSGLAVLVAGIFLSVLNASMSTVVLPWVQRDFGVRDDTLVWFVTGFLIPFAIGTLVYGRLVDSLPLRPLYTAGVLVFAIGSLLIAVAPEFWTAAAARAVQGAGATALPAMTVPAIVRAARESRRPRALGTVVLAVGFAFGIGPLAGGALAEWQGWRAPFWVTAVAAALLALAAGRWLPPLPGRGRARLDGVGLGILAGAIATAVYALNRLSKAGDDPTVTVAGASALVLWGGVVAATFVRSEPLIPRDLVTNARFAALCTFGAMAQAAHFVAVVLLPLYLARYEGLSAAATGLWLAPGAAMLGLAGIAAGSVAAGGGTQRGLVWSGWGMLVAAAMLHLLAFGWPRWGVAAVYAALAASFGFANTLTLRAVATEVPERWVGTGMGAFNLAFFLGGAAAAALAGSILELQAERTASWDPFVSAEAVEFADAALVALLAALAGFAAALAYPRLPRGTGTTWRRPPRWKPNRVP
jgi:DHA2 family metal-tetracycline-proton antiporter-like MFS transporter